MLASSISHIINMYLKPRPWESVEHNMRSTDDALFQASLLGATYRLLCICALALASKGP